MSAALSHRFASLGGRLDGSVVRHNMTLPHSGNAASESASGLSSTEPPGALVSEGNIAASSMNGDGQEPEIHSCPRCDRPFDRLCDLNKHVKSHSRPFKCAFQGCKYWSLGWPTAKELERHVNDKHSPAPRTYPCHYCSYKSKRESNCKQHMEKTHGWKYVRSKANGRRVPRRVGSHLAALQTFLPARLSQSLGPNSSPINLSPLEAQNDFVLFPHEQDHAPSDDEYDDDGRFSDLDDGESQGSDMVIPWTSPDTRLRRRETFLHKFTQKFGKPEDDLPIDPRLSSVGGVDAESSTADISTNSLPIHGYAATAEYVPVKQEHTMSATSQSFPSTPFTLALQERPTGCVPPSNHSRNSSATVTQATAALPAPRPAHQGSITSKRKEDEDPEDLHPPKKFKPSPRSNFRDNRMPDIFVVAHPDVYNRETKSLYQSCETEHSNISTLVRHLSRAPHRLHSSERCVHSFDVEQAELCHVRRGVCRRCWTVFADRDEFDAHLSRECEKVSRGKSEKWNVLYNTFTPLATDTPSSGNGQSAASVAHNLPLPNASANHHSVYRTAPVDGDDSAVAPPSPTTIDIGPRIPLELEGEGELEKLRRENHQYRVILGEIRNRAKGIIDLSRLVPAGLLEAVNGVEEPASGPGGRQFGRLTYPANGFVENEAPDAATLVGQMNSHPTDVDRQGMIEDIQQTFSRTSSGMSSSDKSTIRHVSNSPPQRYEAYHGRDRPGAPRPRSVKPSGGATPTRHQPTSIPDSGYGSDKKLNSVGGLEIPAEQAKQAYPEPTAVPTTIPQDRAARPASASPVPRVPVAEPSSQLEHPPTDLVLDMLSAPGMSPDIFAKRDEDDAYYLSKDIIEAFGDPGYSQPSSGSFQS